MPPHHDLARTIDYTAVLQSLADGVVVADASMRVVFANEAAERILGSAGGSIVGDLVENLVPERLREAHKAGVRRFFETGTGSLVGGPPVRVPVAKADGVEVPVELTLSTIGSSEDEDLIVIASIRDVSESIALEQELADARSVEAERAELLARMRAAERSQAFLLEASRLLGRTAGFAESLDALATLAVPTLGDICLIDIAESGGIVRMAARHADPRRQAEVDELGRRYAPQPGGMHPSVSVMATGRSVWSEKMSDTFLRSTCRDEEHFGLVKRLGFSSFLSVPLVSHRQVLGSITIISTSAHRQLSNNELVLAESLASQAAEVVEKARRYEREHEMAHVLQSSLLPAELSAIPGHEMEVRYLPSTLGAEVGGDWYDVVDLAGGKKAVTIGDVSGHDVGAAAAMGQLRSAARALAAQAASPAQLVEELRAGWAHLGIERTATVAVATFSPDGGETVLASAGHPPPILVAGGKARLVELRPSTPLGAPATPTEELVVAMPPSTSLVMYTDGLIEVRRRPLAEGLERLRSGLERVAARSQAGPRPTELCETALAALGERRSDDVALIVVRSASG